MTIFGRYFLITGCVTILELGRIQWNQILAGDL